MIFWRMAGQRFGLADNFGPGVVPGSGPIRRGRSNLVDMFAPACSRSAAAMGTSTTSIICGPIQHSSWPADGYRTAVAICVPDRTLSRLENAPRLRDDDPPDLHLATTHRWIPLAAQQSLPKISLLSLRSP